MPPSPQPPLVQAEITARVEAIRRLGERLVAFAKSHNGAFPTTRQAGEIDEPLWQVPSPLGGRYIYVGGRISDWEAGRWPSPITYEPVAVGPDRLVLMTGGSVQWMPATEIERALSSEEP